MQDTWIIEVCRTCGAVAKWPTFCQHRPTGYVPPTAEPWTRHVEVAEVPYAEPVQERSPQET